MKTLLIVAHCPSPNTLHLQRATLDGALSVTPEQTQVIWVPPLETTPEHVLNADAIILGTTENLGYMSGALKDFFDRCYYPALEQKQGLPCAAWIRAGHDGTGTKRALESITTGLKWRWVQAPLVLRGEFQPAFIDACHELGAAMCAALDQGII